MWSYIVRQLFSWRGRMSAGRFLLWEIIVGLICLVLNTAATALGTLSTTGVIVSWLLLAIAAIISVVSALALYTKRLHDFSMSAWHMLWLLPSLQFAIWTAIYVDHPSKVIVLLLGFVLFVWIYFAPGDEKNNIYG